MSDREQLYHALLHCAADAADAIGHGRCEEAADRLRQAIDLAGQTGRCAPDGPGAQYAPLLAPLCARLLTAQWALLWHDADAARAMLSSLPAPPEPHA